MLLKRIKSQLLLYGLCLLLLSSSSFCIFVPKYRKAKRRLHNVDTKKWGSRAAVKQLWLRSPDASDVRH